MKIKPFIALLPIAVLGVVGAVDSGAATSNESIGVDVVTSDLAGLRINNICESAFATDYMELLQEDGNDSVLFVGCGGVL